MMWKEEKKLKKHRKEERLRVEAKNRRKKNNILEMSEEWNGNIGKFLRIYRKMCIELTREKRERKEEDDERWRRRINVKKFQTITITMNFVMFFLVYKNLSHPHLRDPWSVIEESFVIWHLYKFIFSYHSLCLSLSFVFSFFFCRHQRQWRWRGSKSCRISHSEESHFTKHANISEACDKPHRMWAKMSPT